jgi:tetratricopeptide (TPR) repeat protein
VYGDSIPFGDRLLNAVIACGIYLRQSFWPTDLIAFYAFPDAGPDAARAFWTGAMLLVVTAVLVWQRRERPYLLVGWLWFGGMLVPMLGLVQVGAQAHADRYMHLPLIGLSVAVAWGGAELARSAAARRIVSASGAVAVAALAVAAWQQTHHWRDGWALWGRVLEVAPGDWRGLIGLGAMHARELELEQAERYYHEAWERDPVRSRRALRVYFETKASHLRLRDDPEGALEALRQAVRYVPGHPSTEAGLGLALAERGEIDEARPHLERAVQRDPRNDRVLLVLAQDAERHRRFDAAIAYRSQLHRIAPTRASNTNNLAWLLATAPDEAQRAPELAVDLAEGLVARSESPSANLLDTLGAAYAAAGRFEEAVDAMQRAVEQARADGRTTLVEALEERLASYRAGRPHVEASAP